ncbi:BglG family transcription antiterminator [Paenibacillus thermoaerophilus]|uniref:BglG family transcription antiterminator n=1 Tax=Paenibacillus thermoaerophilus TaxID=1215385 RepID=A0ABW2V4H7_9BACL|nr:BglG family transcription antiterminator [Paenibacillus thermoaerophilus]TMV09408.1 PRD domain-containing protein [Paenibacillus thermoaerophilus]
MIVSNRQRRILEVLLNRQGEVTASEIAKEVQISTRTVHREMLELEPLLSEHKLSLIKKSGIGISLQGNDEDLARFKKKLGRSETATYSAEERKVLIICRLLEEAEPLKLFALAHQFNAAIPTISRDLDEIEPELRKHGLKLVRRRGYGVEIAGDESAKRNLIVWLAQEYLDESDLFGAASERSSPWPVTRQLLEMVGKPHFFAIEKLLWSMEEGWANRLPETEYTRLLIRLSVAVTRMRQKHWIQPSERTDSESGVRRRHPKLERIMEAFDLEWPEAEQEYVQSLLDSVEENTAANSAMLLEKYGLALAETAFDLIRAVGSRMDIPFEKDRSLLDGLIRHLGPALERLREGEAIRNPLLTQIKRDYETLFAAVREAVDETLRDVAVPDEEIGYLVMHFGASAERWKMFPRNVRALLVCTSGIGSSKLLAVRIHKEIPQIELLGHYSWYEAARIPQDRYDLIISTVDLPVEPDRYIKLSPLLTPEETEKLRAYIRTVAANTPPPPPAAPSDDHGPWERLKLVNTYTSEIVQVLDQFEVYPLELAGESHNLRAVLTDVLAKLAPKGMVQREDILVEQLVDREKHGTQLIPDTKLALFHTRSEWVRKPVLSLFRLNAPLMLDAAGTAEVRQILLMLAPRTLGRPSLEVLSEVSAMLLQPEMIRMLEEEDADTIKAFISQQLEAFVRTKWEWREQT